jgi:hypothetical protein
MANATDVDINHLLQQIEQLTQTTRRSDGVELRHEIEIQIDSLLQEQDSDTAPAPTRRELPTTLRVSAAR